MSSFAPNWRIQAISKWVCQVRMCGETEEGYRDSFMRCKFYPTQERSKIAQI